MEAALSSSTAPCPPPTSTAIVEARRHGVWRRRDLTGRFTESRVQAQLDARRWQAPLAQVVVLHNGPLTEQQTMWAVLMAGPPGTLLHGLSGLEHDGFSGFKADALSVVIPGSSANPRSHQLKVPGDWDVRVRWSTMLGHEDVNALAIPPRTRVARSVLDAASDRVSERRSRVIVLAAVQQQLVRPGQLWSALGRRGRCRNRRLIVESINDADGGVQSLPERELAVICRRLRLPEPERQQALRRADGHYFLDNDWPDFGIRAEIHGIPHARVVNWDDDLLRQNDVNVTAGLLVFSSYAVRRNTRRVAHQLLAMFRRRGWTG
jgi:hypothetical protein